jgi:DNA-binding MarR family transcriptional regulator
MIDALESAGLVERRPDTADRRSVRLGVTGAGRGLLDRLRARREAKAEALFGRLTAGEQEELARMLERVLADEPQEEPVPS